MPQETTARDTITTRLKLGELIESANIAELLPQQQLDDLGATVVAGYIRDKGTRTQWEERNAEAIKLALQVKEAKSFPWENCSNVKFPLLTIAALQFLARISVMTKGKNLAKAMVIGPDVDGKKSLQAKRISQHLSLQLTDEDPNWIDMDEQAKFAACLLGSAFKKTYYDSVQGIVLSEHVPAMDFVVDYFCKDVDRALRATHVLSLSGNAIQERVRRGLFLEMMGNDVPSSGTVVTNLLKQVANEAEGLQKPVDNLDSDYTVLEQHCWLDLDGDDYAEPYVVSVREDTKQVLRIVAKYFDEGDVHRVNDAAVRMLEQKLEELKRPVVKADGQAAAPKTPEQLTAKLREQGRLERKIHELEGAADNHIVRIDPVLYFTRTLFIPSPDGGVYGLGLGALLGPMNSSVDTLVNQLIDNGTMGNTAGGFLGRGVKMKAGNTSFNPFEWKPVDSSGDDLRKNIFPLPVREASTVLFQLLGMLVAYSEKISGATDIMTGVSPGQNTPAETSRNTVEQGMMLFSGIYGRMYRGFREELKKFVVLNKLFLRTSPRFSELTSGSNAILAPDDYTSNTFRITPAASPEAVSASQRKEKANTLMQLASGPMGAGFNKYLVTLQFLDAYEFDDVENIFPDPQGPKAVAPPQNPKVELEKAKLQQAAKEHDDEMQLAVAELKNEIELNGAKVVELQAKAAKHLAEANGVDTGHQIALLEAQIGAAKAHQEGLLKGLSLVQKSIEGQQKAKALGVSDSNGNKGSGQAGMGASSSDGGASGAA